MGGKNKQSQRTKNNVRPSSSGRSAELLNNASNPDATLSSVGGGKILPALFPTLAAVSLDPGLNPEFAMCIKKLNKKDPITKTKALHELTELVNKSTVEDVEAALLSWSHFYKILSLDVDCKVREATQACHAAVCGAAGRRLAPHLRRLLPAWLQAQHDDHASAQALAHLSLHSTFPEKKLPEVISFCKAEIMEYLTEAALARGETPEAERAVASALRGAAWVLQRAPPALHDWLQPRALPLLADRLAAHPAAAVRAAWFRLAAAALQRWGGALGEGGRRVARALLHAREPDPLVAPHYWRCLLALLHLQNWHEWVDKRDLLVKRVLNILENGGWGDARAVSASLPELAARLPADARLHRALLAAALTGLEKKSILNSRSERQAWITGLAECLCRLSDQDDDYVVEVVTEAHRTWLENVLSAKYEGQLGADLVKHSAARMASLVKFWSKRSAEDGDERYDRLVRNFWQNVGSTVSAQIDELTVDEGEIAKAINKHTLLLETLARAPALERRPRIKFEDERRDAEEEEAGREEEEPPDERHAHHAQRAAAEAAARYLEARAPTAPTAPTPRSSCCCCCCRTWRPPSRPTRWPRWTRCRPRRRRWRCGARSPPRARCARHCAPGCRGGASPQCCAPRCGGCTPTAPPTRGTCSCWRCRPRPPERCRWGCRRRRKCCGRCASCCT